MGRLRRLSTKYNFVLTGSPPVSTTGTGDFLLFLDRYTEIKVGWIPKNAWHAIKPLAKACITRNGNSLVILVRCLSMGITKYIWMKTSSKDSVLLCHPQSIGFKRSAKMIRSRRVAGIFVLDNSFFCICSYNWNIRTPREACMSCAGKEYIEPYPECRDNILDNSRSSFRLYRKALSSGYIQSVYVQNKNQAQLWKECGYNGTIKMTGLATLSIMKTIHKRALGETERVEELEEMILTLRKRFGQIAVIHANKLEAKGWEVAIEIAKINDSTCFIFPESTDLDLHASERQNIIYGNYRWESGLSYLVKESDAVIVPSIWTCATEATLIKSMLLGKQVFVLEQAFLGGIAPFDSIDIISISEQRIEGQFSRILGAKKNLHNTEMVEEALRHVSNAEKTLKNL